MSTVDVVLVGDTMLGRGVAQRLSGRGADSLFSSEVVAAVQAADLAIANLECCISSRGAPAPKGFVFRGPPVAAEALARLGIDAVTLANNHSLDYGPEALVDTLAHLDAVGIRHVGAGPNVAAARRPLILDAGGLRVGVVALSDHPEEFAVADHTPGIAYANLEDEGVPGWVDEAIADAAAQADVVVVTPHWGPNMNPQPLGYVRSAAEHLIGAGATMVAGHSAHVFQGMAPPVLYDLGDFIDDYASDRFLRNDLGVLVTVSFDGPTPVRLIATPLRLDYCSTRFATGEDAAWVRHRVHVACANLGVDVSEAGDEDGRLVIPWR